MTFVEALRARAAGLGARVAFGEASDPRVIEAAQRLAREGVAKPVLVVDPADAEGTARARATGLECVDPSTDARADAAAAALLSARAKHGMTPDAAARLARDPLGFSIFLA